MIPWLDIDTPFPDVEEALTEEQGAAGLLAAGADLSPSRLLDAYSHGIFPWYCDDQPILWWSTNPRMVLMTTDFRVSDSLKRTIKKTHQNKSWSFTFDTAFTDVITACTEPRKNQNGTWITEDIIAGYTKLHHLGFAHSSEVWFEGKLVGGAYGICIGKMFYGESMFARVTDASKMAFVHLVEFLKEQQVEMIDCQQETKHLASFGAKPIPRKVFILKMQKAIQAPPINHWPQT